ncbi:hypothetical protein OY671_002545 [Metschnikowia pulcherrima]|nr:hypothetical protein OY671_002545 [Metschnikowia pulcherrima]
MKKLSLSLLAAGAGYLVWRKYTEDNAERDLWAEVTDTFDAPALQAGGWGFESPWLHHRHDHEDPVRSWTGSSCVRPRRARRRGCVPPPCAAAVPACS